MQLAIEQHRLVRCAGERWAAREHGERNHRQRVHVGLWTDRLAAQLLGGGEHGRAVGDRCIGRWPFPDVDRDAEVGEECPVVGVEQNVARFDVSVHDTVAVGGFQRRGDLIDEHERALKRPRSPKAALQRTA